MLPHSAYSQAREIKRLDGSKITTTEIDRIITKLMDTANVQGLSIGILNANQIEFIKSYGFKNKTEKELLDTSTVLYAASFSKPVFAFLTLKLVQENLIDLDTPLYKYLPKPIPEYEDYAQLGRDQQWKIP